METLRKQGTPEKLLATQYEPFKTTFIKKHNRSTNYVFPLAGCISSRFTTSFITRFSVGFCVRIRKWQLFKKLVQNAPRY
jgi:ABC-2 type transport system permease protein